MSTLDEKLKEISEQTFVYGVGTNSEDIAGNDTAYLNLEKHAVKVAIEQIKQAFIDEHWITPEQAKKTQGLVNQMANMANDMANMPTLQYVSLNKSQTEIKQLMTGPEWYARFEKELYKNTAVTLHTEDGDFEALTSLKVAINSAKRASGAEE